MIFVHTYDWKPPFYQPCKIAIPYRGRVYAKFFKYTDQLNEDILDSYDAVRYVNDKDTFIKVKDQYVDYHLLEGTNPNATYSHLFRPKKV